MNHHQETFMMKIIVFFAIILISCKSTKSAQSQTYPGMYNTHYTLEIKDTLNHKQ